MRVEANGQIHELPDGTSDDDVASFLSQMEQDSSAAPPQSTRTGQPENPNYNKQWLREGIPVAAGAVGGALMTRSPQGARAGAALAPRIAAWLLQRAMPRLVGSGVGQMAGQAGVEAASPFLGSSGPPEGLPGRLGGAFAQGITAEALSIPLGAMARGLGASGRMTALRPTERALQKWPTVMDDVTDMNLRLGQSRKAQALRRASSKRENALAARQGKVRIENMAAGAIKREEELLQRQLRPHEKQEVVKSFRDDMNKILLGRSRTNLQIPDNATAVPGRFALAMRRFSDRVGRSSYTGQETGNLTSSISAERAADVAGGIRDALGPRVANQAGQTKRLIGVERLLGSAERKAQLNPNARIGLNPLPIHMQIFEPYANMNVGSLDALSLALQRGGTNLGRVPPYGGSFLYGIGDEPDSGLAAGGQR